MISRSRVRGELGLEWKIVFHDLLLFGCCCQGDILGMLSARRKGDESLQSFLVTIKIPSVLPVFGRLVLYMAGNEGPIDQITRRVAWSRLRKRGKLRKSTVSR